MVVLIPHCVRAATDRTLGELLQMFGSEVTVKQVITQQVQSLKNHQQVTTHVAAWNADAYAEH